MIATPEALTRTVIAEIRRRLITESVARLEQCLSLLTDEEIWHRPNRETVSIGNLVLHLCGNVRQWILSGLGGEPDIRTRQAEFDEPGPIPREVLVGMINEVASSASKVLDTVTPDTLMRVYNVQGFEESGSAILIHVTEHFSYHVGQVTYAVKCRKAIDLGFYDGVDLSRTGADELRTVVAKNAEA